MNTRGITERRTLAVLVKIAAVVALAFFGLVAAWHGEWSIAVVDLGLLAAIVYYEYDRQT